MRKLLLAIALAAGMVVFAQSPPARAQSCTDAYLGCARACLNPNIFGGRHPQQCNAHCTGQRTHCMRTGSFRHIGNSWTGLKRS
jgi:hypothetical protein